MSLIRKIDFVDGLKDVFGRPITVSPKNLVEVDHIDSKNDDLEDELLENGGTTALNINKACVDLSVTATAGSRVVRQLHGYATYQPYNALQCTYTCVPMLTDSTETRFRAGYFDDASDKTTGEISGNGLFFQYNETIGSGWSVVVRSYTSGSQVDKVIEQANWNKDKLDGTGLSGLTLSADKRIIFFIQFGWLGLAPVRFGVQVGNQVVVCHEETHDDVLQDVYMSRGSLPFRYEIENLGSTANTLRQICSSIDSIGGYDPSGFPFSAVMDDDVEVTGALTPMLSLRLKSGFNRRILKIINDSITCTSNGNIKYFFILNGALTGASWSDVDPDSGVEFDQSATVITGGSIRYAGGISNNTDSSQDVLESRLRLSSNIQGESDIITIACQNLTGASENVYVVINYTELS